MNLPRRSLFRFIGAGLAGTALPSSSVRSASPKPTGAQRWLDEQGFAGSFDLQRRAEEVPVAEYVALAQATAA